MGKWEQPYTGKSYMGSDGWRYYDPQAEQQTFSWVNEKAGLMTPKTAHERLYKALQRALKSGLWSGDFLPDVPTSTTAVDVQNAAFDALSIIEDMISEIGEAVSDDG